MRSVTKVHAATCVVFLAATLSSIWATPLYGQIDRRPTSDSLRVPWLEVQADSVKTVVFGASLGVASGTGEALDNTGAGLGLQLSAGYSFGALTELHIGAATSSYSDDVADGRVTVFGLFAENLYKKRVSSVVLYGGLRVVWMWLSRANVSGTPNGPGIGLFAGGRRPISTRVSVEASISYTSISFTGVDYPGLPDIDDQANGTVWGLSLGLAYFLNPER
ncbi:MAG: hypothetical protein JSW51_05720 [Gemmatimonadota bacterium]|nr:MAG: hypothetical protein JSW51_05720 [Gemmatimonadota bacterium]